MKEEGKNQQPNGSLPKVGTARRAVPNLRREAPCPQQGRLQSVRHATPAWQAAAKVGRLRRGIPTHSFRRALPRHWCVRRSPSLPKVGTARRAVPNFRREAPCPQQRRLQPMRHATPAWQAAAKVGRLRRGIPTHSFRGALPRHLCVRCSPSFPKAGTARRAVRIFVRRVFLNPFYGAC
jgi:type IV secretory pathway VirJ component